MRTEREKEIARIASRKYRENNLLKCRKAALDSRSRCLERDPRKHRKLRAEAQRRYRVSHPEWERDQQIRQRHDISAIEYDTRLAEQNNLCALCNEPFNLLSKHTRPCLDHNHGTNVLRQFIHEKCNKGLGMFMDNADVCRKAAEYLERHGLEEG